MNTVSGKVVGKESGRGIANLLVEIFDVDPKADVGRFRSSLTTGNPPKRLGAVATDGSGAFSLAFGSSSPELGSRAGINLILTVSAPEDPGEEPKALYVSRAMRRNAGQLETYLVQIAERDLEAAGVRLWGQVNVELPPVDLAAKRLLESAQRDVQLASATRDAGKVKIESAREVLNAFRADFLPALEASLSRVTPEQAASETFVPRNASVLAKHREVIDKDLASVVNEGGSRKPVRSRIALTDDEVHSLESQLDDQRTISQDELKRILNRPPDETTETSYLSNNPIARLCRQITDRERECAAALGVEMPEPEPPPDGPPSNVTGTGVERIESDDIPRYLARLTDTLTSPEEGVLVGLEPRATQGSVVSQMRDLAFQPSPADTTAYHEFHNLQVAFRHVWQEAIDEGVLSLAEAAYSEIVEAGGTPRLDGRDPIRALVADGQTIRLAKSRAGAGASGGATARFPWGFGHISGIFEGLNTGTAVLDDPVVPDPLPGLLAELNQRLQEEYTFTTFAANKKERSVNFGTLITYQQEWRPLPYQAGKLAKTITLAPKEIQKYTKTVKRHRKRAEKEVEKHLSIRKEELSQTSRSEQDIIRKANTKTNFQMSSEATTKDPTGSAEATIKTSFEREASNVSESVKKAFHESVMKAAQEFNDEFSTEINTEESEDFELIETGEISNPNDELAVTFLFYELQRRYRISERIYRLTPVVLVAQEMPKPHEINEAWLVTHDWILRRVLLDDSFAPALTYLSERIVGDQVALIEMRTNITQQRQIIAELKRELGVVRARVATYRNMLERSLLQTAAKKKGEDGGLFSAIPVVGDAVDLVGEALDAVGEFINPDLPNVGDSRQDTLKETIQRTVDEERDLLMRVEREVTALNASTETYSKALAENYNHRTQVLRLRTHIKQNILYYMQAIWNHEPPDQRYLRLHEVPVPTFNDRKRYRFDDLSSRPGMMNAFPHRTLGLDVLPPTRVIECQVVADFSWRETKPLAQVADLDNLLGYFGNYMIFALKRSNPLTDFMMEPYVLQGFNELTDPDDLGNLGLDEFVEYFCCLKKRLTAEQFEQVRAELKAQYDRLTKSPRRDGDEVTIPTGSLFIEALPATASIVERYKAIHRAIDVKKVQAEVRYAEIENLRLVDRLLNAEREDPKIDKKVIIEGPAGPTLPVDDPN